MLNRLFSNAHARRPGIPHRLRSRLIETQPNDDILLINMSPEPFNQALSKPTPAAINDTEPHGQLRPFPVVVMVSLPCLTPLVLTKASDTFLMSDPLPFTTSTSKQLS